MKKFIYISLFCLPLVSALNAQSVTYNVTKDDPYDIKNLTVAVDPLFIDLNGLNGVSAGLGFRGEYTYGKRFTAELPNRSV